MERTIAVIGAGPVGRALAGGLHRVGHQVIVGVRNPDDAKHDDLRSMVRVASVDDATAPARLVVLAVPADALASIVSGLRLEAGTTVVDATNAVFSPVPAGFETLGHFVASMLEPDIGFVKAFNTIGAEHLGHGEIDGRRLFLPIAGDDIGRAIVADVADSLGFAPVELGGREAIALVENHARLWIHLAINRGWGRAFGFTTVGDQPGR